MRHLDEITFNGGPIRNFIKRLFGTSSTTTQPTPTPTTAVSKPAIKPTPLKQVTTPKVTAFTSTKYPEAAAELNRVFAANPVPRISAEDAAKVARLESSMNPYAGGTFRGYGQVSQDLYSKYYGADSAKVVMNEYANKTRSFRDAALDYRTHLNALSQRIGGDRITFGRIMVNQFAPNSKLDDKISDRVWNNNVRYMVDDGRLPSTLVKGVSTYRDLMNAYDTDFYEDGKKRPKR